LQWENLLPLIEESLSNSNFSMLVGDSKQAIYRFRNGEVELFSNLPKIYNKDNTQLNNSREHLLESQYQEKVLEYNYRSAKNIVEFNNQFFENLINNETDEIKKHYSKLKQKDVKQHNSYIKLELINTLNKEEFLNEKHLKIESYIERAISSGFKPEDICYLARTKKSISALANYLISKDYNVVSSESLLVANSTKVSMIISLLYMMSKPAEKIFLADFIIKYAELNSLSKVDDLLIELIDEHSETYKTVFKIYNVKTDLREILSYSIYEICEYIIRVLKLNKESDIFLQFFLDFVYKAQNSGKYTLIEFLDYWEEKKSKIFINTPPKNDAINLMTAHKSKGLDFKVVIVDLNASLPNKSPSTWTDVRKLKIPKLEKTLVSLNMKSVEAGLEAEYDAEKTKERLDFINLMYVCFTRASHALFAISAVNKRNEFGKYLMEFIENNSNDELIFECGNLANKDLFEEGTETLTPVSIDYFPSVNLNNIIKISPTEEFDWNDIEFKSAESYGKIIHKILSEVRVVDDLKPVINKYINLGFIKIEEKDKVLDILKAVVMHPELVQFYSRDAIIKNEIDIYTGSGKFLRPDRLILINNSVVILDYKTGKKLDKHRQQIRDYINLIADFGYTNVEGLLVYLGNDVEVVKVH